ncbi:unnamed protein product [Didymodactylos carnosus]|uniref:Uncharacterized protein n=1 Tax=Didymodactylos carnosus TaxID=1234261 RepID=A0A8S2UTA5_9BILA|nr:unnamed protein product [Didymodactylos carnosus]
MVKQRKEPAYKMTHAKALELADKTAKQYQISLGSDTLPRLLLRNLTVTNRKSSNDLESVQHLGDDQRNPAVTYTGRIVISLSDRSVRIEACNNQLHQLNTIIEHELNENETNLQQLLARITRYGGDRNVQLLQLIDLNLLSSQSAYNETKIFETLKERYDECVAYDRSLIVYDLDSLIGVSKSESDSSTGKSSSFSIVNQNIYTYVRARFREAVVETARSTNDAKRVEKWGVAVTRQEFLLRQFCNDVGFARTRKEEDKDEDDRRKNEDFIQCVKCKDFYIENENKMGSCIHHDGFIYDNAAADLAYHSLFEAMLFLSKIESDVINDPDRREELERQKTKFKWICCGATLPTGGPIGGCKKGKHGFSSENQRLQHHQQRRQYEPIQRLDEDMIMEWETACREVYNNQWIELLRYRT